MITDRKGYPVNINMIYGDDGRDNPRAPNDMKDAIASVLKTVRGEDIDSLPRAVAAHTHSVLHNVEGEPLLDVIDAVTVGVLSALVARQQRKGFTLNDAVDLVAHSFPVAVIKASHNMRD